MKYKVGQKVRIKSLDWYNKNKDNYGAIYAGSGFCFWKNMARHCGEIMKITIVKIDPEDSNKGYYFMENSEERWTDEMIEGLVEEEVFIKANDIYNEEYSKGEYCHEQSFKWGFQEGYNYPHEKEKLEINLKNGYEFKDENGNVINAKKIILEKKKKEYPKTYEECRDYIESCYDEPFCADLVATGYKSKLIESFARLLICRDAYWKIAGEEMGLGKPWKPDWTESSTKYIIDCFGDNIAKGFTAKQNTRLAFPTEEMRDAFKENFDPDIEICKEFL